MNKKVKIFIMNVSDRIVSILYTKKAFLHPEPTIFIMGNQYPKMLNILRRE